MKNRLKINKKLSFGIALLSCISFSSCVDEIDDSNRFTFVGETISDYLENRSDKYSNFITILKQARVGSSSAGNLFNTLTTYGNYSCFAPTNEAIERFLFEQDSTYQENLRKLESGEIDIKDFVDTGIHSPYLENLSDSMALEISKNHLIERGYFTTDLTEGAFPSMNMNDRFMTLAWVNDDKGNVIIKINNNAVILEKDSKVENGVIQTIDAVLSPSTSQVCDLIRSQSEFSIFSEALYLTGLDDSLRKYRDESYEFGGKTFKSFASGRTAPYPKTKYYKNTVLVETNATFKENGINNVDDLIEFANEWYGTTYSPNTDNNNYKSRNNPLNRFISYHILDRQLQYTSGSGPGGFLMENYESGGFKSEVNMPTTFDRYDYFETLLPYSQIKVTKPFTNDNLKGEIVLNYAQDNGERIYNPDMRKHINTIVYPMSKVTEMEGLRNFDQNAINGIIQVIDRILVYNKEEMSGNILNERMRWNFASLFPEWTNNNIRWALKATAEQEYYIPNGYTERIKVNSDDCHIYYLCPTNGGAGGWTDYQGDELFGSAMYDFEYRLPYVPEGTYEIRFGYSAGYYRGVVQFYVDGKVTGIPKDLRINEYTNNLVGWIADTGDRDLDDENDKAMRNRGFMKGPDSVVLGDNTPLRGTALAIRAIICMTYLSGESNHWIRFKNVLEDNSSAEFMHNYLEMVPKGVLTSVTTPEDRH